MSSSLRVTIKVPTGAMEDYQLTVASSMPVLRLKNLLAVQHPCRPLPRNQRLVCRGTLLKDDQLLSELLPSGEGQEAGDLALVIHLVISTGDYGDRRLLKRSTSNEENEPKNDLADETPTPRLDLGKQPVSQVAPLIDFSEEASVPEMKAESLGRAEPIQPENSSHSEISRYSSHTELNRHSRQAERTQVEGSEQSPITPSSSPPITPMAPFTATQNTIEVQPVIYETGGLRLDISNMLIWDGRGFYKVRGVPNSHILNPPLRTDLNLNEDRVRLLQDRLRLYEQQFGQLPRNEEAVRVFHLHIDLSLWINLLARLVVIGLIFGKRLSRWKLALLSLVVCLFYLFQRDIIRPPERVRQWYQGWRLPGGLDQLARQPGGHAVLEVMAFIKNFVASLLPNHAMPEPAMPNPAIPEPAMPRVEELPREDPQVNNRQGGEEAEPVN